MNERMREHMNIKEKIALGGREKTKRDCRGSIREKKYESI